MATHDYVIANQSGAAFRTDLNNALAAIVSNNSNSSQPGTRYAYQWWADTSAGVMKIRNSANDGWIELFQLDGTITLEDGSNSAPALAFRDDLDTGIFSDAANEFNVATGGVERFSCSNSAFVVNQTGADVDFRIEGDTAVNLFYVDAGNNKVGINTNAPEGLLHVLSGSAGTVTAATDADELVLEASANVGMSFLTANDSLARIKFGDPDATGVGAIVYNHANNNMQFNTGSAARVIISADMISSRQDFGIARTAGGYTFRETNEGSERAGIRSNSNNELIFKTASETEAFRIDSSQRILVATTSSNSISTKLISKCVAGTSAAWAQCGLAITHASGSNRKSLIGFGFSGNGGTNPPAAIGGITTNTASFENNALVFYTRNVTTDTEPTERMRITPYGSLQVSNSGSFAATNPTYHDFSSNAADDLILRLRNTTSTNPYGLRIIFDNAAPNDSTRYFIQCNDSSNTRFQVNTNGGIQNFQSNDSNLCDEREKKNIVSLGTKWDKVKSWELKKFHYNEDADTDDLRYGVIAQQVEEHCPEVLTDWIKVRAEDAVLDEDGNVVKEAVAEIARKGVKEQQMMWMAIKALQEAQTRIETLETKVAALEAA